MGGQHEHHQPERGQQPGRPTGPAGAQHRDPSGQTAPVPHHQRSGGGADEQRLHSGVGAEVDTVERCVAGQRHAGRRRREHPGAGEDEHRRAERARGQRRAATVSQRRETRDHGRHHQRPEQVVLLLDGQRPRVLQRRRRRPVTEVIGVLGDEQPIGHPEQGGHGFVAQVGGGFCGEQFAGGHHGQHHHDQRGQQPPGSSNPEAFQTDPAGAADLVQQQRGDQEPTEHEEHVDAEESAGHSRNTAMVGEHQRDRDRSDTVERSDATTRADVAARPHTDRRRTQGSAGFDGSAGNAGFDGSAVVAGLDGSAVGHVSGPSLLLSNKEVYGFARGPPGRRAAAGSGPLL